MERGGEGQDSRVRDLASGDEGRCLNHLAR